MLAHARLAAAKTETTLSIALKNIQLSLAAGAFDCRVTGGLVRRIFLD